MGALRSLSEVVSIRQGSTFKIVVISAGYSIAQLLADTGLKVHPIFHVLASLPDV